MTLNTDMPIGISSGTIRNKKATVSYTFTRELKKIIGTKNNIYVLCDDGKIFGAGYNSSGQIPLSAVYGTYDAGGVNKVGWNLDDIGGGYVSVLNFVEIGGSPNPNPTINNKNFIDFDSGSDNYANHKTGFCVAITKDNTLGGWGMNKNYELGLGFPSYVNTKTHKQFFFSVSRNQVFAHSYFTTLKTEVGGENLSSLIASTTNAGKFLIPTLNPITEMGIENEYTLNTSYDTFTEISNVKKWKSVVCNNIHETGYQHILLDTSNKIYRFGGSISQPIQIGTDSNWKYISYNYAINDNDELYKLSPQINVTELSSTRIFAMDLNNATYPRKYLSIPSLHTITNFGTKIYNESANFTNILNQNRIYFTQDNNLKSITDCGTTNINRIGISNDVKKLDTGVTLLNNGTLYFSTLIGTTVTNNILTNIKDFDIINVTSSQYGTNTGNFKNQNLIILSNTGELSALGNNSLVSGGKAYNFIGNGNTNVLLDNLRLISVNSVKKIKRSTAYTTYLLGNNNQLSAIGGISTYVGNTNTNTAILSVHPINIGLVQDIEQYGDYMYATGLDGSLSAWSTKPAVFSMTTLNYTSAIISTSAVYIAKDVKKIIPVDNSLHYLIGNNNQLSALSSGNIINTFINDVENVYTNGRLIYLLKTNNELSVWGKQYLNIQTFGDKCINGSHNRVVYGNSFGSENNTDRETLTIQNRLIIDIPEKITNIEFLSKIDITTTGIELVSDNVYVFTESGDCYSWGGQIPMLFDNKDNNGYVSSLRQNCTTGNSWLISSNFYKIKYKPSKIFIPKEYEDDSFYIKDIIPRERYSYIIVDYVQIKREPIYNPIKIDGSWKTVDKHGDFGIKTDGTLWSLSGTPYQIGTDDNYIDVTYGNPIKSSDSYVQYINDKDLGKYYITKPTLTNSGELLKENNLLTGDYVKNVGTAIIKY